MSERSVMIRQMLGELAGASSPLDEAMGAALELLRRCAEEIESFEKSTPYNCGYRAAIADAFKVCQGEVRVQAEAAGPDEKPTDRIAYAKKNTAAWLMNTIRGLARPPLPAATE